MDDYINGFSVTLGSTAERAVLSTEPTLNDESNALNIFYVLNGMLADSP